MHRDDRLYVLYYICNIFEVTDNDPKLLKLDNESTFTENKMFLF